MSDSYLLDAGWADERMIRRWAFDPDAEFMEQDEDLVLHDWEFTDVILELAARPKCPKADYILSIWNHFTRHITIHQVPLDLDAAAKALEKTEAYSSHPGIRKWIIEQSRRLSFIAGEGATDEAKALTMAENLLNGADRQCPLRIIRESGSDYLVELSVPHGSHKEWLLIDKHSGKFRYSRVWLRGESAPRWFESLAN